MSRSDLHSAWARLFLASLRASGVREVVLSPGSRSTPLALAAAATPGLRITVVVDERVASFVALGIGRASGIPAVLLCTSGTAGAHYLPAIVEASEAEVPLIAVTADRPWELQRCGASQTIDQRGLFGGFVRHAALLGEPHAGLDALRAVPRVAAQVVAHALAPVPGPVHVDAAFRKPLEPVAAGAEPWNEEVARLLRVGPPRMSVARPRAGESAVAELVRRVQASRSPVLVAGPARSAERRELGGVVAAFVRASRCTLVAEVASGARFGPAAELVIGAPDELLGSEAFVAGAAPDLMIEVGLPPVSSAWSRLAATAKIPRIVLGAPRLADPHGTAEWIVDGDVVDLLRRTTTALASAHDVAAQEGATGDGANDRARSRDVSLTRTRAAGQAVSSCVRRALAAGPWGEAIVARRVVEELPEGAVLLLGNSGIVREVDAWAGADVRALEVHHQRGVAGIDGLVAGGVGARLATEPERPVVVMLGDVAALHDLGALVTARSMTSPLVIVVVHNDGGRIFEQLPIAGTPAAASSLEELFVVPHGLSLAAVAASLGLATSRVESADALATALREALAAPRATVIEAVVAPREAGARRRALGGAIERAIVEALR